MQQPHLYSVRLATMLIVCMDLRGCAPYAVSPESITASVHPALVSSGLCVAAVRLVVFPAVVLFGSKLPCPSQRVTTTLSAGDPSQTMCESAYCCGNVQRHAEIQRCCWAEEHDGSERPQYGPLPEASARGAHQPGPLPRRERATRNSCSGWL